MQVSKHQLHLIPIMHQPLLHLLHPVGLLADVEERDAVALERLSASLRTGYLLQPGATEAGFQKALPGLIEEHRQAAAAEQASGIREFASSRVRRLI